MVVPRFTTRELAETPQSIALLKNMNFVYPTFHFLNKRKMLGDQLTVGISIYITFKSSGQFLTIIVMYRYQNI